MAIFDFELIDTSLEGSMNGGPRPEETARLVRLGDQLRALVTRSDRFSVVDIGPVRAAALAQNLQSCGGCDAALAAKLGAELSLTGTVQKVSSLILNVNFYVRDVATRKLVGVMSADFRGDTDESWSRSLEYLARNRLLMPDFGTPR